MTVIRVRAPASSANLGPGFDCAAVALDLWNELEVRDGDGVTVDGEDADDLPHGSEHLGVRAYELLAPTEGRAFAFTNRIPVGRGLGASAAAIALGLVAATLADGRWPEAQELLRRGVELEGHPDNLAAALAGGACLTWAGPNGLRTTQVALTLPLMALVVVPEERVDTAAARAALPEEVPHGAAAYSAGRAALLGAGLATGDPDLLASAFDDRLHEPYRAATAPLLAAIRAKLPSGAEAATLSGSGPSVVVWARDDAAATCTAELRERFPEARVLPLAASPLGAGPA